MKKILSLLLCAVLLAGCGSTTITEITAETAAPTAAAPVYDTPVPEYDVPPSYVSRFDSVTGILLSDSGITVDGGGETSAVFTSNDIIYYENRNTYDSGNPYGEGTDADKHTAEEAAAHTVVNITQPGTYRISGKLSAGQIRIDLGSDAYDNPDAVVELILNGADITCTVAPALLFLNVYECDGDWSAETAQAVVDTTAAGANLILEGSNTVSGSYVAKIFKDKDGEKKLWKQDGAIYSYMSLNVFGPGSLKLNAANEGLDTELHLTINGGNIWIFSENDGINTNEDDVSVTTINDGNLNIFAGLGAEGDGIDSNGYLVINGGSVLASAKPLSDAGLDSELGSFIHGGIVIATGSAMNWAESDSRQVTLNLQFASHQEAGSKITVTLEDESESFSFKDDGPHSRGFSGLILSTPFLKQGDTYHVYVDGVQMAYAGTDMGFRGQGGMHPGEMPEGFDPGGMENPGRNPGGNRVPPEGFNGEIPTIPADMERPELPEGETFPESEPPRGSFGGHGQHNASSGESSTDFYMKDMVNAFSGITAA